jgi:hypothetical protein
MFQVNKQVANQLIKHRQILFFCAFVAGLSSFLLFNKMKIKQIQKRQRSIKSRKGQRRKQVNRRRRRRIRIFPTK